MDISFSLNSLYNISRYESVLKEKLQSSLLQAGSQWALFYFRWCQVLWDPLELRFACKHMETKWSSWNEWNLDVSIVKAAQPFQKMPGHTFLKGSSRGLTQWKAWNFLVITKVFVKLRIWILMPYKQVHNIVLISNILPYK